jgi:prepilin-type N-terminal cleavage/methylation domain-containing protein
MTPKRFISGPLAVSVPVQEPIGIPRSVFRLPPPRGGFTLVELLAVIAIIAVLAAITMGLTAAARNARINSRARTELQHLQTAIEAYKAERNAFPPDHILQNSSQKVDPVLNPLYYELIGMTATATGFRPRNSSPSSPVLTPNQIEELFGRRGFLNASANPSEPARAYLDPKDSTVWSGTISGIPDVTLLVAPFTWPSDRPSLLPAGFQPNSGKSRNPNPWRYVSTSPTNNPGGFDLWVEVPVGGELRVFKNW